MTCLLYKVTPWHSKLRQLQEWTAAMAVQFPTAVPENVLADLAGNAVPSTVLAAVTSAVFLVMPWRDPDEDAAIEAADAMRQIIFAASRSHDESQ